MNSYNLLVEVTDPLNFQYTLQEAKSGKPQELYIEGPFMMAGKVNQNNRMYDTEEMNKEVNRYVNEMVKANRAMGELNHPTSADVDLERACHLVTDMYQQSDLNIWYGKSKVLSTPCGQIIRNLIQDNVRVGVSSRSLGQLEERNGINHVKNMKVIAVDCVADPSYTDAFVNGILEAKSWILDDGKFHETYDKFEGALRKLPRKDVNAHIQEKVQAFINELKTK